MPIDPNYPQDRKQYLLDESKASLYITKDVLDELLKDSNEANPQVAINQNNIYCALHTSGLTGMPKLSLLTHKNIINFAYVNHRFYDSVDATVSVTIVTFDAFIQDTVISIINGVKTILGSEEQIYNQSEFEKLFINTKKALFFSAPTKLMHYIKESNSKEWINHIKTLIVGEIFSRELYDLIRHQSTMIDIYNGYGPTETTCGVTYSLLTNSDITIGKPIANIQIFILDKYDYLKPIGQIGELCIAGDGVGAGYLNRPELTAEKFVDNPFGEGKMYKTGDLAYWREDGNIMFVGRNDFQVKIRGLRIELGEIEAAICSTDGISQAVVVVRKDESGRQLICAFYTEKSNVYIADIKKNISDKLPKYMMPHIFTRLDEMPLTPSGKINRKALPEIDLTNITSNAEYVKPQTELQRKLTNIMETVIGISPIGLNDDFFDIGGDSLEAIEYVSKAHNEGIYFNLQAVFDNPTVAELCEYIENGDKTHVTYQSEDFDKYKNILSKNVLDNNFVPPVRNVGNIFVTGATGFLGSHIIDAFMSNSNSKIYCLVRENADRLYDTLNYYFGDMYKDRDRIIPIVGDFATVKELHIDDSIDFVIHTAASVKHYGSYQYFYDMNVVGTQNVINFAKRHNAKLIHISTLSVSGNTMADAFDAYHSNEELFFDETSLFIGQPLDNVYARSKFEAEKAVMDAMLDGLQANIIRVGNLTNRYSDCKFQKNYTENAFAKRVKAVLKFGAIPDYLMPLYCEFSPIDDTAKAIFEIAHHFNMQYTVFNCNSNKVVYFDKLIEYLHELKIKMEIVSAEEFVKRLDTEVMEFVYEALINDMDENSRLVYDSNIRIINDFTINYLKQIGFEWSDIDIEYIRKYIGYFRGIGYLEV